MTSSAILHTSNPTLLAMRLVGRNAIGMIQPPNKMDKWGFPAKWGYLLQSSSIFGTGIFHYTIIQGLVNVPIKHHLTIRDIIFKIPKKGHFSHPCYRPNISVDPPENVGNLVPSLKHRPEGSSRDFCSSASTKIRSLVQGRPGSLCWFGSFHKWRIPNSWMV